MWRSFTNLCLLIYTGSYLVFDFPPRQLTDHEFNQHVEKRPKVIMAAHFLQNSTGAYEWVQTEYIQQRCWGSIVTLFLCALIEAYLTVPLKPATGRGWKRIKVYYNRDTSKMEQGNWNTNHDAFKFKSWHRILTGRTSWLELVNWRAKPKSSI